MVAQREPEKKETPDAAPLDRARLARLNVIGHRLTNVDRSAGSAMDWASALPEAVLETPAGENFLTALTELNDLTESARFALRPGQGEAATVAYARLLDNPEAAVTLAAQLLKIASVANRLAMTMLPLHVAAEGLRGREGRRIQPFDGSPRERVLSASAAAMLIDARWITAQAARISSAALDPKRANVERVKRHRARQKAGFSTVTVHYHESDLDALRALGFLNWQGPYSPADIASAFEAFQQAALAMVASPTDDAEHEQVGLFHIRDLWGHWRIAHWAERLAALFRIDRG